MWQRDVQQVPCMVLVELILRIVVFVEEGKGDMRFCVRMSANELVGHSVLAQEIADHISYMVRSRLGDHLAWHTGTPQRYDAVERRSPWNCFLRLVILKQDVQHRFSYSDDTWHRYL